MHAAAASAGRDRARLLTLEPVYHLDTRTDDGRESRRHTSRSQEPVCITPSETRVANNRPYLLFLFFFLGRNTSAREALYKSSPMYDFFSPETHLLITILQRVRAPFGFVGPNQPRVQPS